MKVLFTLSPGVELRFNASGGNDVAFFDSAVGLCASVTMGWTPEINTRIN